MATAPENEVVIDTDERTKPPFLRRVRIRGYKSIAFCDVTFQPLTILVGRNASGKSNFLDALAFLRDVVVDGLATAVKRHGGRRQILCRDAENQALSIEIEAATPWLDSNPWQVEYRITISFPKRGRAQIVSERLHMTHAALEKTLGFVRDEGGIVCDNPGEANIEGKGPTPDRPFLGSYPFLPALDLIYRLSSVGVFNFRPEAIRRLQSPDPDLVLERDGSNLASVMETTRENDEEAIDRIGRYLAAITGSVELLGVVKYGDYETVRFRVLRDHGQALEFDAASMSDGTLRTLAALVAAFQSATDGHPSLVAIEEPETSLHPAAMRALVDALDEATGRTQILLTTHSAELLDNPTVRPVNVRVVELINGQTVIGPVDEASLEIVRQKLDTLGGLERQNQLEPDADDLERQMELSRSEPGAS